MRIVGLLCGAALVWAAVGARGGAAPHPAPLRDVKRIVMLGDSITQAGGQPGGYVSQVGYYLRALYPDHPVEIVNAGVSGHRSSEMRERFERDVLERKPDLVTISVGINDVWHGFDADHPQGDGPRGIPLTAFEENVHAMVESARRAQVRVLLFTTTVFEDQAESPRNRKAREYNRVLRRLSGLPGTSLADQNAVFAAAWQATLKARQGPRLTTDQVHLTPAGETLMARVVLLALGVPERDLDSALPDPAAVKPEQVVRTNDYSEGAVVDWDGNVYFSHGKAITKVTPNGSATEWASTGAPNGHKILANGNHLVCDAGRHAVLELNWEGREVRPAADRWDGKPLNAPNDLTLDPEGGLYFTDPGGSSRQNATGSVYHVTTGGHVSRFATGFAFPNGIALAADRKRLYVAESGRNRILAWDLAAPGRPAGEHRVFADLPAPEQPGGTALPDGIALDARGNLWVAHFGARKVRVLDPAGRLIGSYDGGNLTTSNLCFGGPKWDQLYVTGGDPGCLFRLALNRPGLRLIPTRRPRPPRPPRERV